MSVLNIEKPAFMAEEEIVIFEDALGKFFDAHAPESRVAKWREDGVVERAMWTEAGEAGLLCLSTPEAYGGVGGDYRHEVVFMEQLAKKGVDGFGASLHNAIVAPYIFHYGSEEQKKKWLPRMATGELIGAIAMTEPGAGSDLQGVKTTARKDGNHYVISGQKTFITNGQTANLIIVVAKTDPSQGAKGTSLFIVDATLPGFARGKKIEKMGQHTSDTAELFFQDVRLPASSLLGELNKGFVIMMTELPRERLGIAAQAVAAAEGALDITVDYVLERKAFGQTIASFQNTRFTLAEVKTEIAINRAFYEKCADAYTEQRLTAEDAAMLKYASTEMQCKTVDQCLQLFGGYGYTTEYPISRFYTDARIQRIYGGTSEIMRELVARSILGR